MLGITLLIALLITFRWILTLADDGDSNPPLGLYGGVIGVIVPIMLILFYFCFRPTAMDVYQGKTTLEITYKDSVAVDSVVVFKRDIK